MDRDTRLGSDLITRANLWRAPWNGLCRLAVFIGLPYPDRDTPIGRRQLVESIHAITRTGTTPRRKAA